MVALFSYGTLQQRDVQLANYGRKLIGQADALIGYRLDTIIIADPHVVELSGKSVHTIAWGSANPDNRVVGTVFSSPTTGSGYRHVRNVGLCADRSGAGIGPVCLGVRRRLISSQTRSTCCPA